MEKQERTEPSGGGRLREILGILAKHQAAKGMTPQKLRAIVEDLGPTFVKLGQMMSMRLDMLPAAYCQELTGLHADVKPMSFSEVRQAAEAEYQQPLEEVFSSVEEIPLGSASIAQVHAAVLQDGRRVAVKVQRPGVREIMARDIRLLHRAAGLLNLTKMGEVVDLGMVLDEMWSVAQEEMDFLIEARNAEEFRRLNREVAFVESPEVVESLSTSKILVMERIEGVPIDDLDVLRAREYDLKEIGLKLADNYIKQVLDDGFFHADPHPGNLCVRGGKLVWLDLGMMGRLSERDRELLQNAVKAMVRGDAEELEGILLSLCAPPEAVDHERLTDDIRLFLAKYGNMELGSMKLGAILEEMMGIAKEHRLSMPPGVSMLGRGLLNLEGVLTSVSPEINLIQIMANRMSAVMLREFDWKQTAGKELRVLLESGRKAAGIPARLSDWLELGLKGGQKLNVRLTGTERLQELQERGLSRLVRAILAAALLVGASLVCAAGTQPVFWGIPLPAWIGYAAALGLGVPLLWELRRK